MFGNPSLRKLLRGMGITALATFCGVITGLPAIDPDKFNIVSWKGILHITLGTIWIAVVREARYIEDWLKTLNGKE
jgi:hypothetical protein